MNDHISKRSGTSFKGYLLATYQDLVQLFGEPITDTDNYKVDAEWIIDTPHGVATIYNYKDGKAYLGDKGTPIEAICEWHAVVRVWRHIRGSKNKYVTIQSTL